MSIPKDQNNIFLSLPASPRPQARVQCSDIDLAWLPRLTFFSIPVSSLLLCFSFLFFILFCLDLSLSLSFSHLFYCLDPLGLILFAFMNMSGELLIGT